MTSMHVRSACVGAMGTALLALAVAQTSQPPPRCIGICVAKMDNEFVLSKYGRVERNADVVYRAFDDGSIERTFVTEKGWMPWANVEPVTPPP